MKTAENRVVAAYQIMRDLHDQFWVKVEIDGVPYDRVGPFATNRQAHLALEDLKGMIRSTGGLDMPAGGH